MITVTRTTRATGNAIVSHFATVEDCHEYIMYSHYDNTNCTKSAAKAIANTVMVMGHHVNQLETDTYLWTVDRRGK